MNTPQHGLYKAAHSTQTQRNGLPPKTSKPLLSSPSTVPTNIASGGRQDEVYQDNLRASSFSSNSSSSSINLNGSASYGHNGSRHPVENSTGSKWTKETTSPVKSFPVSAHESHPESLSRPSLSSVSAVQASLPALEARHVKSQEVAKPILQHAMAPRKSIGISSQTPGTFQRYNVNPSRPKAVGPLASGRCEALTLVNAAPPPPPPAYDQLQHLNGTTTSQKALFGTNGSISVENEQQPGQNTGYNKHAMVLMSPMERPDTEDSVISEEDPRPELYISNRPRWSAKAYQLYMTLRLENILKYCEERRHRRLLLEQELDKSDFDEERRQLFRQALNHHESRHLRWKRSRKMGTKDFDKVRTVGVGAFGEVVLARKKDSGDYFAIKILNKADIKRRNQDAHVTAERDILSEASNEWVVKLFYSFQDEVNLYFVMEYVAGGDLMRVLEELQQFDEELARFYTSELVLAIGSVHEMGFVHRDIKPDNILIDRHGHIKLTDFGLCTGHRWTHRSQNYHASETAQTIHVRTDSLAFPNRQHQIQATNQHKRGSGRRLGGPMLHRSKKVHQRQLAHSQVGTPNYMAPEVITSNSQSGYTQVCDWWSMGVILYEMLYGRPPFHAESAEDIQYNIIHHDETLRLNMGYNLSPAAVDLVAGLICSAEDRLGSRGTDEIKNHPFFQEVDWSSDLRQRQAPYVPLIRSPEDTSNFDVFPEYSSAFPSESASSKSSLQSSPQKTNNPSPAMDDKSHHFFEFTFRRFFDTQTFDKVAVLRTPICENEEGNAVPDYSSQYNLHQPANDSWNVTAPPPLLTQSYAPESAMAYQCIREPPPYSAAVNFDAAILRGLNVTGRIQGISGHVQPRSAQRDDNAAVYV